MYIWCTCIPLACWCDAKAYMSMGSVCMTSGHIMHTTCECHACWCDASPSMSMGSVWMTSGHLIHTLLDIWWTLVGHPMAHVPSNGPLVMTSGHTKWAIWMANGSIWMSKEVNVRKDYCRKLDKGLWSLCLTYYCKPYGHHVGRTYNGPCTIQWTIGNDQRSYQMGYLDG